MNLSLGAKAFLRKVEDHAPALWMAAGVISMVGAVVSACTATVKAVEVLDEYRKDIEACDEIEGILDEEHQKTGSKSITTSKGVYTMEDVKKDRKNAAVKLTVGMTKKYALAVLFFILALVSFFTAYGLMKKRYTGAVAALTALTKATEKYRERVRERVGTEVENALWRGDVIKEKVVPTGVVDKDGNEITETVTEVHNDGTGIPPYAKFFDESNPHWDKNAEYNRMFLLRRQDMANDRLHSKVDGVLLLNEVYSMLDLPMTELGNEVGWVWNKGDEFVDFGIYRQDKPWSSGNERARAFVNGQENVFLLDFNCVPIRGALPKA